MSYDSLVAALSSWGYWKEGEASGNLADSSGNARTMTVTGTPTYAQTGPGGNPDSVSWTNTASQHAETSATTSSAAFTHLIWVKLPSNPAANVAMMSRAIAYNTAGAADGRFYIRTDGKPEFSIFTGVTTTITGSTALSLGTWVLAIASVGAAGMKIRINKTTIATNAANAAYTGANQKIFIRGGDALMIGTAPLETSHALYIEAQLSDAQTDALVDAMTILDATVAAPAATATASTAVPTVSATASVVAPVATATASALAPAVTGTGDATVLVPAATATAGALVPSVSADAGVVAPPAAATASAATPSFTRSASVGAPAATATASGPTPTVDNGSGSQTVFAPAATATATALAPTWSGVYDSGTDIGNALGGRTRDGLATVTVTTPAATPPTNLGTKVDKAIAYPTPVMDNGRVT